MANVQRYLEQFHGTIKVGRFDENATLREKRDRVLKRLDEGLKELFDSSDEAAPKYRVFNQGGYAMGTGTKPVNDDFDIDVGVSFRIAKADYADPVEPKEWVYNAVEGHTKKVEIRRNCVTVWYQKGDEAIYHVDLAVYSDESSNPDGRNYLAKGKCNSTAANRIWEESDPQGLIDLIQQCQQDSNDAKQFRRTVRYLKRWRDVKFPSTGNAAPVGIGITVAAYYWFMPVKTVDPFSKAASYDDLEALRRFIQTMVDHFQFVYSSGDYVERLIVSLPVVPRSDIFTKMTDAQMGDLKTKLQTLLDAIEAAQEEADPVEACKLLQAQFGSDFPVPPKKDTGQKRGPAIISSSASAQCST
ncbi:MAG: nucleotidyltransferase [Chloroflexota bacterium]|nr:MAG: nucleotidyltransferase [Chloroflexota bacterium]